MKRIINKFIQLIKDNKNISITLFIVLLIVSVSIAATFSYYSATVSRNLISGKIGDITLPDFDVRYMIENKNTSGNGTGTYYSSYKAPVSGYTFVSESSSCTNGAIFTQNEDNTFTVTSSGKTKCNFYFNAISSAEVEDINLIFMKERKKIDGKGAGVYETVTDASINSLLLQGYIFNGNLSKCSDDSLVEFDFFEKRVNLNALQPNLTCTVYFKVATKATVGFIIDHGSMDSYIHEVNFNGSLTTSFNLESGYLASDARLVCDNGITGNLSDTTINLTKVTKTGICRITYISQNFAYTGTVQNYIVPETGNYKLQVWGAEGGNAGGKGGYSEGKVYLTKGTKLYIQVGGAGLKSLDDCSGAGYNGGGCAYVNAGGGGGATDIRIGTNNNYHRLIVAGGGGGKGYDSCAMGGAGGGISGVGSITHGSCGVQGGGGTSYEGGIAGTYASAVGNVGVLGEGASGKSATANGGGGGGGFWGGGSGASDAWSSGGGGGSGFIYTEANSSCTLAPKYYLTAAFTLAGDVTIPSITGATEEGHAGDGYAIISIE